MISYQLSLQLNIVKEKISLSHFPLRVSGEFVLKDLLLKQGDKTAQRKELKICFRAGDKDISSLLRILNHNLQKSFRI